MLSTKNKLSITTVENKAFLVTSCLPNVVEWSRKGAPFSRRTQPWARTQDWARGTRTESQLLYHAPDKCSRIDLIQSSVCFLSSLHKNVISMGPVVVGAGGERGGWTILSVSPSPSHTSRLITVWSYVNISWMSKWINCFFFPWLVSGQPTETAQ